jgi:mitochondrial fission protein ELM1
MSWFDSIRRISGGSVDEGPRFRHRPDCVTLPPRTGVTPADAPPVRIFLGTEDGQYRAERVFLFSVQKYRDPARTYEIHLMKNLAGFTRGPWRTNFTNYRFAIPDYAGREGLAIYNDVDQIYLDDPAKLFDTPLDGRGFLAVSADDTSVMLLDCAKMAEWWNLEAASSSSKSELLAGPAGEQGTWGPLDPHWNARDMEYEAGRTMCLHYTALHTQPWRPTPDQYSYHPHPLADLWHDLEREADAAGFLAFTQDNPSHGFAERITEIAAARPEINESARTEISGQAKRLASFHAARSLLSTSVAKTPLRGTLANEAEFDPTRDDRWPDVRFDGVVAAEVLEHLPAEDVPWFIEELFSRADRFVYVVIRCSPQALSPAGPSDADPCFCYRSADWWRERFANASRRYPNLAWHVDAFNAVARTPNVVAAFQSRPTRNGQPPRVWVLLGAKGGDNAQLRTLADALGWPYEFKQLSFNTLHSVPAVVLGGSLSSLVRSKSASFAPPWPDVVISAGKRSVPVARWIREQSGGKARLVHLGRPWAPLDWFDLIITTPQYRLPSRPNVLHNTLPLNIATADKLADALASGPWRRRLEKLPRPHLTVLVGGNSPSYVLTRDAAAELGASVTRAVRDRGGSALVTTSPRTPIDAVDALEAALDCPNLFHRWEPDADNPYLAFLAAADSFVVTGDSASMLAEACTTGKPVAIFEVPARIETIPGTRALHESWIRWRNDRVTYRGTPKQQDWLARVYDGLVTRGYITPPRDLAVYHEALETRGLASRDANGPPATTSANTDDVTRAVERVQQLIAGERRIV